MVIVAPAGMVCSRLLGTPVSCFSFRILVSFMDQGCHQSSTDCHKTADITGWLSQSLLNCSFQPSGESGQNLEATPSAELQVLQLFIFRGCLRDSGMSLGLQEFSQREALVLTAISNHASLKARWCPLCFKVATCACT